MIIPAIIPASLADLTNKAVKLKFADTIQVDVVDGIFTPFKSWPYEPAGQPAEAGGILSGFKVEVDLMVSEPLSAGQAWLSAGASALVFHLETLRNPENIISLDRGQAAIAVAISNDTPVENIFSYIGSVDYIQLMGIRDIGTQGQHFDERVLERIAMLSKKFPNMPISIDGGVNKNTIANLQQAGATRFVVGSAILNADEPETEYQELLKMVS